MNNIHIYTVTTVRSTGFGCRCVGFFHEFVNAAKTILNNYGDINENGYYLYAVIEKVKPGIYYPCIDSTWFIWDDDINGYKKLDKKPERFNSIINFSIG